MTSWKSYDVMERYDVMAVSTVGIHGNEVTQCWQLKKCIFDGILHLIEFTQVTFLNSCNNIENSKNVRKFFGFF